MKYFALVTTIGLQKIAEAVKNGTAVNITKFAIGDGGGVAVIPSADQTGLANKLWEGDVLNYYKESNTIIASTIVPAEVGTFTVREMGIFDSDGDLFAVANVPDTVKSSGGSVKSTLSLAISVKVDNAESVQFTVSGDYDSELSDTSINAVQNKVVKISFDELKNKMTTKRIYGVNTGKGYNPNAVGEIDMHSENGAIEVKGYRGGTVMADDGVKISGFEIVFESESQIKLIFNSNLYFNDSIKIGDKFYITGIPFRPDEIVGNNSNSSNSREKISILRNFLKANADYINAGVEITEGGVLLSAKYANNNTIVPFYTATVSGTECSFTADRDLSNGILFFVRFDKKATLSNAGNLKITYGDTTINKLICDINSEGLASVEANTLYAAVISGDNVMLQGLLADTDLNGDSPNAIANKVVNAKFNELQADIDNVLTPFELTDEDDLDDITGELFWGDYGNNVLNKPANVDNFHLKQINLDRNNRINNTIENGKTAPLKVQILYAESIYKRVKMIEYEGTKSEYWTDWQIIG